ncbi:MAG: hypothetical protein L0387_00355 [Acidobacteria bacterium]|nr:hypothetical protein [Acidobacteriota bacterium]MCI0718696.1 hypothetical protein [Acidobacteriota bacterium]
MKTVLLVNAAISALLNLVLLGGLPYLFYFAYHKWRHKRGIVEIAQRAGLQLGEARYVGYSLAFSLAAGKYERAIIQSKGSLKNRPEAARALVRSPSLSFLIVVWIRGNNEKSDRSARNGSGGQDRHKHGGNELRVPS